MAYVSLDELKYILEVTDEQLSQKCSDDHLQRLARRMDDWRAFATALELFRWQIREIETDSHSEFLEKSIQVLQYWKQNVTNIATYFHLAKVCLREGNSRLAGEVCKLSKGEYHIFWFSS